MACVTFSEPILLQGTVQHHTLISAHYWLEIYLLTMRFSKIHTTMNVYHLIIVSLRASLLLVACNYLERRHLGSPDTTADGAAESESVCLARVTIGGPLLLKGIARPHTHILAWFDSFMSEVL